MDLLWSQLSREDNRACRRGTGLNPRAWNFYRGRRSVHSSRAWYAARRSDCPPWNQEALLPRNARRCSPAQQGSLPALKRLGLNTMFLGLEAIDRGGLKRYRNRITRSKNFETSE